MDSRSAVPQLTNDVAPLAAVRPRPEGSKARPCIAAKFLRLCTVHMHDLYLGPHNSMATVAATLASTLEMALKRLTALLDSLIWKQGRRVEDGWLWNLVLYPGFVKVAKLMKRSRLPSHDVNLVCLLSLKAALKACPSFSPQIRAGVKAMLVRCKAKIDVTRMRAISDVVTRNVQKHV